MKPLITHAELLEYCTYNQFTGHFFKNGHSKGRVGYYDKSLKQRVLCISGKKYRETRLAVFYVTGQWPTGRVKTTSSRRSHNTKFRDLVYETDPLKDNIDFWIKHSSEVFTKPKKTTFFQRFLNMFPRI